MYEIFDILMNIIYITIGSILAYQIYLYLKKNGREDQGLFYDWGGGSAANPRKQNWVDGHIWTNLKRLKSFSETNKAKKLKVYFGEFRYFDDFVFYSKIPNWLRKKHESTEIYVDAKETARGVLVIGSAGAGKTEWINNVITQPFYKKSVTFDKKGSLGEYFYRPGIDILVNVKLENGIVHDVLSESVPNIMTFFETLMNASIGKEKDFFTGSAQQELEVFAQKVKIEEKDNQKDKKEKWNLFIKFYEDKILEATAGDDKTQQSVMATVKSTMELLYLTAYRIENGAETFTVKDFFESPDPIRLFLNATDKSLNGMLAATTSVLINYQLKMKDIALWDPDFLVAYFLDEYLSLAEVMDDEILAEISRVGRSKGICPFKLIQSLPTDQEKKKELISNVQYVVITSTVEPETLKTACNYIGQMRYKYYKESITTSSSGTSVSQSLETEKRDVVTDYMIKTLQNEGFAHIVYGPKINLLYKGYMEPADLRKRDYIDIESEIDLVEFYKWKIQKQEAVKKTDADIGSLVEGIFPALNVE
jgi:hypothetical protein